MPFGIISKIMNIANKLTMLRVIMIPFFLLVLYLMPQESGKYIATLIFVIASLTDWLDGYLARKLKLVTNFGKFMDPLADKLLVATALIYLSSIDRLSAIVVIIIISREFVISGFRLVAANNNLVIAASIYGKIKTFSTMIMIIVMLLNIPGELMRYIEMILIVFATLFTIISAVDYIVKNKDVFHE